MRTSLGRVPGALLLAVGVFLGWGLASIRPGEIRAGGGDRSGESIMVMGPVELHFDEGSKVQVPLEALYLLDYKAGRLFGTIPSLHGTANNARYLGNFAERDLVGDFKIDLDGGKLPHFLMMTGALGRFGAGWSPLYVYETTTSQVIIYRIQQNTVGTKSTVQFELIERRSLARGEEPGKPAR